MTKRSINQNTLLFFASVVILIVLVIITVMLAPIFRPIVANLNTPSSGSSGGIALKGTTTGFNSAASSYRNLQGLTLRINQIDNCSSDTVQAYIAVTRDSGVVYKNFGKADVKVFLDNKPVSEFDFSPVDTTKAPLSTILAIDHSGSMTGASIESAVSAASQYVSHLKPNDKVGLVQFDTSAETLVDMTTDKGAVEQALKGITARGDTALYDALHSAIHQVPTCGRKAVTVLTDGEDTASKQHTSATVIQAANSANMPIFSVGIKSPDFTPDTIQNISESTGGEFFATDNPQDIAGIYDKIDQQLSGQFVASFKPNLKKTGATHMLKIISTVEGSDTYSTRSFVY